MADYISQFTGSEIDQRLAKVPQLESGKQDKLVSGSNIKTINGQSVLGSGDMQIQAGDTDAVKYVAQTLTDAQKAQARTNIAAASAAELGQIVTDLTGIEADIDSLEAAVAAINVGDYVTATTLPTASASTMGHIYLIGPDANNNYDRYFTQESGGSYSWVSLGSTQIDLSTYATQAEVDQLEAKVAGNLMSVRAKNALLAVFDKVAFAVPDVSAEIDELNNALFNLDEVTGINAVYTQGNTVIWSDGVSVLNDLKANLVVKAEYGDGTEVTVTNYTLSGTLTTGTSVITVEYEGFTTTFNVAVTEYGSKMTYTMAEGSVLNKKGRLGAYTYGNNSFMQAIQNYELSTETTRRVFVTNFGVSKLRNENDIIIDAYPIKIPKTATKAVVVVSGNNQQIAGRVIYLLDDGRYKIRGDQDTPADPNLPYINVGFVTGTNTIEFSSVVNRSDTYLLIHGKRVSDASYANNEPTAITVTFSNQ